MPEDLRGEVEDELDRYVACGSSLCEDEDVKKSGGSSRPLVTKPSFMNDGISGGSSRGSLVVTKPSFMKDGISTRISPRRPPVPVLSFTRPHTYRHVGGAVDFSVRKLTKGVFQALDKHTSGKNLEWFDWPLPPFPSEAEKTQLLLPEAGRAPAWLEGDASGGRGDVGGSRGRVGSTWSQDLGRFDLTARNVLQSFPSGFGLYQIPVDYSGGMSHITREQAQGSQVVRWATGFDNNGLVLESTVWGCHMESLLSPNIDNWPGDTKWGDLAGLPEGSVQVIADVTYFCDEAGNLVQPGVSQIEFAQERSST